MSFEIKGIENLNNEERLKYMVSFDKATIEIESDFVAMMANLSSVIMATIKDLNWAGFYIVRKDQLVLGPFQGLPACTRLKDKGVCVSAWQNKSIIRVKNVHEFKDHVSCDSASNSEMVLPIKIHGEVIAVLDLDSPKIARFGEVEEKYFADLVKLMEDQLEKTYEELKNN